MLTTKRKISLFESSQKESIREFAQYTEEGEIKVDIPLKSDGSSIIPIDLESEDVKNLLIDYRYTQPDERIILKGTSELIQNVTRDMVEINQFMDFKSAIQLVYNIYKELGNSLYGVFLVNSNKQKINPLHPLSALELMNSEKWKKDEYKIYIYKYSPKHHSYESSAFEVGKIKNTQIIEKNIATQIAIYNEKRIMVQTLRGTPDVNRLFTHFNNGETIRYNATNRTVMDSGCKSQKAALMIPHNILNNGISIPYYGTTIVTYNQTEGHNVSPMMSANIGMDTGNFRNKDRYGSYGVCTGGEDPNTINGLRTLNHSNLQSPMNSAILQPGWMNYVEKCIDYSFMVYDSMLDGFEQKFEETFLTPKYETYMEQWLGENPGRSTIDYIKHVADKNKDLLNGTQQQTPQTTKQSEAEEAEPAEPNSTISNAAPRNATTFIPF